MELSWLGKSVDSKLSSPIIDWLTWMVGKPPKVWRMKNVNSCKAVAHRKYCINIIWWEAGEFRGVRWLGFLLVSTTNDVGPEEEFLVLAPDYFLTTWYSSVSVEHKLDLSWYSSTLVPVGMLWKRSHLPPLYLRFLSSDLSESKNGEVWCFLCFLILSVTPKLHESIV